MLYLRQSGYLGDRVEMILPFGLHKTMSLMFPLSIILKRYLIRVLILFYSDIYVFFVFVPICPDFLSSPTIHK